MSAPDDGNFRHPLSYRSRIFRLALSVLILILVTRLVWGWQTNRQLEAALADLRRQGQPTDAADVHFEHVPDADNAWDYLTRASAAHAAGVDSPSNSNFEFTYYPPYSRSWMQLAGDSEKAHGQLFALARQARAHTRAQFRDDLPTPVFMAIAINSLNSARQLANTLGDGALYAHATGNDPESLDRALDLLHLARTLRHDEFLLSQLVATGIEALAYERIQIIAPGLHPAANSPTRSRVQQLIAELLDEEFIHQSMTRSLQMERLATIDMFRWFSAPTWLIRPLADRQCLRDIRTLEQEIQASRCRSLPQATAIISKLDTDPGTGADLPRYSRWFDTGNYLGRYFQVSFRALADRRATATSLAVQLYRADHGTWPAQLGDLVPAYLPAVPEDPFLNDPAPLGYVLARLPDGTPRPLLYFDAGNPATPIPDNPVFGWQLNQQRSDAIRQYRDLSRFAPSPKAVDHDPEKSDGQGNTPNY